MKEKLFVLSMDAMVREDVAYMLTKPNFRRIMEKRAEVDKVLSVFPSITYPAHTTLTTGCYPGKHGIYNNVPFKDYDDNKKHWYRFSKVIRVDDLFNAAKRAGCTTASVYWPITGCHPDIDYIINEYFFFYPEEDTIEAFRSMGANEAAVQAIEENRHLIEGRRQKKPGFTYDSFLMGCACSLIRNVQPDVMLVHNCILDSARHRYGVFSEGLRRALDEMDEQLGDVIDAMETVGVYEQTNFVILSDHGQLDYEKRVRPNVLLAQGGFLEVAPDGSVYDWQAFAQNNAMSASIYLRDPANKKLYDDVYAYLQKLVAEEKWGFTRVYTTEEVKEKYGTYGPFSFMLATDEKTAVSELWTTEAIEILGADEQRPLKGTHGYEPELGPQPIFLAHGPAFKDGAALENAKLVDIAPTLAAVLGQTLTDAEGHCLTELLC
ncbi:MAG: alkaline phosphatase family protein [Ruminococcaceae bacterium]|nr:alkaline phosphatase family protein [Oscillospiraceae bacterium]